jgi:hypothetical protein
MLKSIILYCLLFAVLIHGNFSCCDNGSAPESFIDWKRFCMWYSHIQIFSFPTLDFQINLHHTFSSIICRKVQLNLNSYLINYNWCLCCFATFLHNKIILVINIFQLFLKFLFSLWYIL